MAEDKRDSATSRKTETMSQKQIARTQNKKRKIEAFLALAKKTELPDDKVKKKGKYEFDGKSPEEIIQMKIKMVELREQKSAVEKVKKKDYPKLSLTLTEMPNADTSVILHMAEIQKFLVFAVTKGTLGSTRPWCKLMKPLSISHVGFLVIDGVSIKDFKEHKDAFPNLQNLFDLSVEVLTPDCYGMDVADEVFKIPMTKERINSHVKKFGRPKEIEGPIERHRSKPIVIKKSDENITTGENNGPGQNDNGFQARKIEHKKKIGITESEDVFPRTWLLLNVHQMLSEGYILPGTGHEDTTYNNYVYTTTGNYQPVTDCSPMFALDCEMVMTTAKTNELARVSLISEDGICIYDSLVKPYNKVINYLTKYSGITKKMMDPVQTRLRDAQRTIQKLLPPDAILVGQSMANDLKALKMYHPYVIDTSVIYNQSGQRTRKTGLARLTQIFFGTVIQADSGGHNPVEDASSALNLVLLKLSKGFEFGDVLMSQNVSYTEASHSATAVGSSSIPPVSFQTHREMKISNDDHDSKLICVEEKCDKTIAKTTDNEKLSDRLEIGDSGKAVTEAWRDEVKMKVFYSCGSKLYDDFFAKIKTCDRTGVVIDKKSNATHESDYINYEYCDDYDEISKKAASTIAKFDFAFIRLEGYRKYTVDSTKMDENLEKRLDCLKQLDSRAKELHDLFPNNSVVVVLLTGRKTPTTTSSIENALCFMKVTHSPERTSPKH
ncbi:uncharacterized protein LOC141904014 [Tubulanus polymorphus]|uniref:uncharacterized protein LOC141904014 n=1 Tax=Tubulanus polymorphus TaxID=672921 RepID=UPI003DA40BF3